jgi:hypothetical protein
MSSPPFLVGNGAGAADKSVNSNNLVKVVTVDHHGTTRGQCYETFYARNLRIFVIS